MCLVTGTERKNAEHMLGPLLARFDAVVTHELTTEEKPHPAPYLLGAKLLSTPPERCVAFENAPRGIASAKRAGARCIAITSTLPRERLLAADAVVGDLNEALSTFVKLGSAEPAQGNA